jgi:hypothetical protein
MTFNEVNDPTKTKWVQSEIKMIAGEIASSPAISPKKYQLLSKELNVVLETLDDIKKAKNVFAKALAEQLKEQSVKLCGDLENNLVQWKVSQIEAESQLLKKGQLTKKLTQKVIKQLKTHIRELEENHLTERKERRIVADAQQVVHEAEARMNGTAVLKHFRSEQSHLEDKPFDPEDVDALYDVARAVWDRDFRLSKKRYEISLRFSLRTRLKHARL